MSNLGPMYLVRINGNEFGPLSVDQLREMAAHGTLGLEDEVQRVGGTGWRPAGKVSGLFARQPPPVPSPYLTQPPSAPLQHVRQDPVRVPAGPIPPPIPLPRATKKPTTAFKALGCLIMLLVGVIGFGIFISGSKKFNVEAYYRNETTTGTISVFIYSYKPGITKTDVERHSESLMHTSGGVTEAYYYPEGASIPRDGVTLARGLLEVWSVIDRFPGWKYHYSVLPGGSRELSEK